MAALLQLVPGQVFARDFRILSPLAEGGMGAVYVVEQLSTGKRRALKVMLPQLVQDARARERFAQESRIGGHLESEHVVEVVSAGIDEPTGMPWLAMELLEGRDLSQAIRERGPLPVPEAYEIFQQIGEGLGAAHARGIVHRDLKPENLFITVSRRRGVPFTIKILDFGIAKLTQESRATASATAAVGSPMWMAPEQTEQHSRLRPATDVWALGLVAFHVVTGRFYWRVANQPEVRLTALFTEVLVTPIETASMRAGQLGAGHLVPPGFDAWFARCVDRDPDRRFPDARAAIGALTPTLGYREGVFPMTVETPRAAAPVGRVVAPTMPMSAIESQPGHVPHAHVPHGLAQHGLAPHGQWNAPSSGHGGTAAPTPVHPAMPGALGPLPIAGHHTTTPYAVHGPSTATGAVVRPPPRGRGMILALGLLTALIGAGLSSFGGLLLWQRITGERPVDPIARRATDAGVLVDAQLVSSDAGAPTLALVPDGGGTLVIPPGIDLGETDAGIDGGLRGARRDAGRRAGTIVDAPLEGTETGGRFAWSEGSMQRWSGTWSGHGWRYAITLILNRNGSEIAGTIEWRLLEGGTPEGQARVGDQCEEWVTGTYGAAGALTLTGYQSSDTTLVNPDRYDLRVATSGAISGSSRSDGGRISARPAR